MTDSGFDSEEETKFIGEAIINALNMGSVFMVDSITFAGGEFHTVTEEGVETIPPDTRFMVVFGESAGTGETYLVLATTKKSLEMIREKIGELP